MSSPDSVRVLQQSDIVFRDNVSEPDSSCYPNEGAIPEEEIVETITEEMLKLCKERGAYFGYAGQGKGDIQSL